MSATIDTLQGIKTAWAAATSLNAAIPAASRLSVDDLKGGSTLPYCKVMVVREQAPEYQSPRLTGQSYQDWRRATFTVYDSTLEATDTSVDLILTAFASGCTIPNASLLDWSLAEETDAKFADDIRGTPVYMASVEYVVHTERLVP